MLRLAASILVVMAFGASAHAQVPADSVHGTYEASQRVLDDLAGLGVDYHDVVQVLEDEGVAKFDASWDHLGQQLAQTLNTTGTTSGR